MYNWVIGKSKPLLKLIVKKQVSKITELIHSVGM